MKKIIALLLVLSMTAGLSACSTGSDTSEGGNSGTDSSATSETGETGEIDTSEFETITYMALGDIPNNQTEHILGLLNEKFKEEINAEMEIKWIEWTNYLTNYNLALASQDGTVDLITTGTTWLDAWPNAQKGAFLPLSEEMIQTYAPMTWESVDAETWDICKYNDEIYFFPEDNYTQWTNHGFMYRGDWATEAGLTEGVNNWDQMGEYLQYVKDAKGIIPWDVSGSGSNTYNTLSEGWVYSHTDNIIVVGPPVQLFYGNSAEDPYTLSTYYQDGQEFVDYAIMMKEWNDAGYWRTDVLNYSGDEVTQLKEGTNGTHKHHTQTWTGLKTDMDKEQPDSDLQFFWFGQETGNVVTTNKTHGAMAIGAQSDTPERAMMMYDLMRNDEEIYQLMNYGVEGEQYLLDDNGYRITPEGFDSTVDGVTFNFWGGRNDDVEIPSGTVDQEAYSALKAEYDAVSTDYQYGKVVFDFTSIQAQLDNLSNIWSTYMPQIAYGKSEDPVAYVAEFRAALEAAGYSECMAEIQKQIQAVYQ